MKRKVSDEEYYTMTVAERLYNRRREIGMNQQELADAIQRHVSSIGKFERAESTPSFVQVALMADKLGCTLDWLAGNKNGRKKNDEPEDPFAGLPLLHRKVMHEFTALSDKNQREVLRYVRYLAYKAEQRRIEKENGKEVDSDESENE